MTKYKIPFNRPFLTGKELTYIQQAMEIGHLSGDGEFTHKCHSLLEKVTGSPKALLTTSCTHALEMCALLLNIQEGDEFIVPSFSFVTTANAFVLRGAKPVFIDIRPDTLNLDESDLEALISPRTKAIVALHYAGVACEMDTILEVAGRHDIPVVEDSALGLFGKYKGKPLGSFGDLATLSFHETKSFTCGEGGALLINNQTYQNRAEILREKGTNRTQFFQGQVDKYTWVDLGSSYLPADILAAFLYAQLEGAHEVLQERQRIWNMYSEALHECAEKSECQLPQIPSHCNFPYTMFYMLCPSAVQRTELIAELAAQGIQSVFHYLPLHFSKMGQQWGYKEGDFPVAEKLASEILSLPMYPELEVDQQEYIVENISEFLSK